MPGTVQSVERAAAMLQLLASEDESLGLMQVAGALGLAKGTAHGLLRTLVEVGFVVHEPSNGRYAVSPELFRLGTARLDLNELRARALNWTDTLAARTGESARVAAFRDGHAVLAHHVLRADGGREGLVEQVHRADGEPARPMIGATVPLHADALGKVLLAFDPGAARSILGGELPRLAPGTLTDRTELYRELAAVRDRGWASSIDESQAGWTGIAAPIRDRGGYVVASVGITGDTRQLCDERGRPRPGLVQDVQRAARSISRELGHGSQETP